MIVHYYNMKKEKMGVLISCERWDCKYAKVGLVLLLCNQDKISSPTRKLLCFNCSYISLIKKKLYIQNSPQVAMKLK